MPCRQLRNRRLARLLFSPYDVTTKRRVLHAAGMISDAPRQTCFARELFRQTSLMLRIAVSDQFANLYRFAVVASVYITPVAFFSSRSTALNERKRAPSLNRLIEAVTTSLKNGCLTIYKMAVFHLSNCYVGFTLRQKLASTSATVE